MTLTVGIPHVFQILIVLSVLLYEQVPLRREQRHPEIGPRKDTEERNDNKTTHDGDVGNI